MPDQPMPGQPSRYKRFRDVVDEADAIISPLIHAAAARFDTVAEQHAVSLCKAGTNPHFALVATVGGLAAAAASAIATYAQACKNPFAEEEAIAMHKRLRLAVLQEIHAIQAGKRETGFN